MKKELNKLFLLIFMLFCFPAVILSKEIYVSLKLMSIEAIQTTEKSGDEVFMNITHYSSLGTNGNYRIPEKPMHWLSSELSKVKNIELWKGSIKENEELRVILTVLDEDHFPFNPEDLIGAAEVLLINKGTKLVQKWSIPKFKDEVPVEMTSNKEPYQFELKGNHSNYKVAFTIDER